MAQRTLDEFVTATEQNDAKREEFQLENPYLLEVNLDGRVWAKLGTMVAYTGGVKFTREGVLEHGVGKMLKRALTGEAGALMKMEGKGRVYLADRGKKVQILNLQDDTIHVNGHDLLAMDEGLDWDVKMMKKVAGMLAGGLFHVKVSGTGMVAITTHYDPLTLRVVPGAPVFTDPSATVAWSGRLAPDITTDVSVKTFFGRGSGESIQMRFEGDGWVVLQPYEEGIADPGQ